MGFRFAVAVPLFDHAHAVDSWDLLERLDGRCLKVLVGIEHGISVFASALVDHALNVGVVMRQDSGDLTDHVRNIGMQASNAARRTGLAHVAGGVVD